MTLSLPIPMIPAKSNCGNWWRHTRSPRRFPHLNSAVLQPCPAYSHRLVGRLSHRSLILAPLVLDVFVSNAPWRPTFRSYIGAAHAVLLVAKFINLMRALPLQWIPLFILSTVLFLWFFLSCQRKISGFCSNHASPILFYLSPGIILWHYSIYVGHLDLMHAMLQ
jgi:hypothetical protein